MPRILIGVLPKQIMFRNKKRRKWELQFLPSSIIAGNTGKIYVKRGSAPVANDNSNTWDHLLNAGSSVGDNVSDQQEKSPWLDDVWAISDTTDQVCTLEESNIAENEQPKETTA